MKRVLGNWRHVCGALFSFWLLYSSVQAQKFSGTGGKITDDAIPSIFSIKVAGLPNKIDGSFGLEKACVNITHTWDNDLSIYLVSPDGSVVDLARRNGGGHDNYTNTCFSQNAEGSINRGDPPFTGSFLPEVPMGGLNNGQNPNGTWKLYVVDTYPREESGSLISWSITFSKDPAQPYEFTSSTLPIVVIQSAGVPILDEPKTKVHMHLIDNGPGKVNYMKDKANGYNGFVGIELRGRSSQRHPKLSFGIETLDSAGQKSKATKLLDLPKDADYVLTANHSDKSLLRNYMAYTLFSEMAPYAPRVRFVDLVMDGQYRGVYLLGEKVKRGKDRVDISKLDQDDNAGDSLTGGYIFKTDWAQGANNGGWFSKYYPIRGTELQEFRFHYPEADDITAAQKSYLQQYVDSFEVAIDSGFTDSKTGYAHYIDIGSFVDVMIMVELGKNVDGYWLSSFYYKDRLSKGGKVHAGPIWDYDLAFGNFEYYQGYAPSGWHWETYGKTSTHIPRFWHFLAQDTQFQDSLKCRWTELRKSVLSLKHIDALIDAAAAKLAESQAYNFEVWPIWGIYTWPNAKPYEEDYESEIARLKDWFLLRITWMDAHMPGSCK
jgi:subtilisin-like proprotein convertase family protein